MEEEISLRELIEVLLKNKALIAIITIVCIIISGIFSFFVIEPTYEAEAKLLLSDLKIEQPKIEGIGKVLDNLSNYPNFNVESYKEQIKNPEILQKTIEQLKLDTEKYTLNSLSGSISVENLKNTNIIKIKVKNHDPDLAAKIANALAVNFSDFISQIAKKQATKSLEYIENQLAVEEEKLNGALLAYKKLLQMPRGVSELESEQASKIKLLTQYKEQLSQIDLDISIITANLFEAKEQLKNTDKYIVTTKTLADDFLLSNYVKQEKDLNISDIAKVEMKSEQVNPLYVSLHQTISNEELNLAKAKVKKVNLETIITTSQKELENLQVDLAEKQHQMDLVTRQVDIAKKTFNALQEKYEEIRITHSSKVGETAVVISSEAVTPEKPISPRKALNLAIAAILGLMMAVFIAFFKEYWKSTEINQQQTM